MHRNAALAEATGAEGAGQPPRGSTPFADLQGKQVCFVIASLQAGGAEKIVSWLSLGLVEAGCPVTILSFDAEDDPIFHRFDPGVRIHRLGIPSNDKKSRIIPPVVRRTLALRRSLKRLSPDVAVSFLTKINALTLAASLGLPMKVLVAERNNPQKQPAHWMWQKALRKLYGRADAIVCQTSASKVCIPQRFHDRIVVIPNPVSAGSVASTATVSATRIAAVGRLEHQKGFDTLIAAFAILAQDRPDCTLDIWGEGPQREELERQAEHLGIADRVTLRGLSDRPGGWIRQCDVFVLSSRYEGFPNVLGEAMAAGLPTVASNCEFGPAELVEDGENGLLVAPEDPQALAEALKKLLSDDGLRERLSAKARDVVLKFAPGEVSRSWATVLAAVLHR